MPQKKQTLDEFANALYAAVPAELSLDEADEAVLKEARRRYFSAGRAKKLVAAVAARLPGNRCKYCDCVIPEGEEDSTFCGERDGDLCEPQRERRYAKKAENSQT